MLLQWCIPSAITPAKYFIMATEFVLKYFNSMVVNIILSCATELFIPYVLVCVCMSAHICNQKFSVFRLHTLFLNINSLMPSSLKANTFNTAKISYHLLALNFFDRTSLWLCKNILPYLGSHSTMGYPLSVVHFINYLFFIISLTFLLVYAIALSL